MIIKNSVRMSGRGKMKGLLAYVMKVGFSFGVSGKSLEDFKQGLTLSICVFDRAGSNAEYET